LLHRGKRSVALDVFRKNGRAIFDKMVERADLLIEEVGACSHTPGASVAGSEELLAINPRLIHCVIDPWPPTSLASRSLTELELQGLTGQQAFMGKLGEEPVRCGTDIGLFSGGVYAFAGIASAIWAREFTDAGQRVDVSVMSALLSVSSHWLADFSEPDEFVGGNTSPYSGPDSGYECADGRAIFGFFGRRAERKDPWRALCSALGLDELLDDEFLREHGAGIVGGGSDALLWRPIIEDRTRSVTRDELMDIVNEIGGAGAPMYGYSELFGEQLHPQVEAIGVMCDIGEGQGRSRGVRSPWANDLRGEEGACPPAPTPGEHTVEALYTFAIPDDLIARAGADGAIP
jgi:crotonobetainyl-CoA:carnitine CoA-transferase CaiB-like acyl-CoA transferase